MTEKRLITIIAVVSALIILTFVTSVGLVCRWMGGHYTDMPQGHYKSDRWVVCVYFVSSALTGSGFWRVTAIDMETCSKEERYIFSLSPTASIDSVIFRDEHTIELCIDHKGDAVNEIIDLESLQETIHIDYEE